MSCAGTCGANRNARLLYGHPIYNMTLEPSTGWTRRMNGAGLRRFGLGLIPWIVAILLWYAVRWSGFVNVSLIPAPHQVAAKFVELLTKEGLLIDIFASTRRDFLGVSLGILIAVPVGFLLGWYRPARTF